LSEQLGKISEFWLRGLDTCFEERTRNKKLNSKSISFVCVAKKKGNKISLKGFFPSNFAASTESIFEKSFSWDMPSLTFKLESIYKKSVFSRIFQNFSSDEISRNHLVLKKKKVRCFSKFQILKIFREWQNSSSEFSSRFLHLQKKDSQDISQ